MTSKQNDILASCLTEPITTAEIMKRFHLTYEGVVDTFDEVMMEFITFVDYGDDWNQRSVMANNKGIAYTEQICMDKRRWQVPVIISIVAAIISLAALTVSIVK